MEKAYIKNVCYLGMRDLMEKHVFLIRKNICYWGMRDLMGKHAFRIRKTQADNIILLNKHRAMFEKMSLSVSTSSYIHTYIHID